MDKKAAETLSLFVRESKEAMASFGKLLATITRVPASARAELVNRATRIAHNIKGTAKYFGLTDIDELSRLMERILVKSRGGELEVTPHLVEVLARAGEKIDLLVDAIETGHPVDLIETLTALNEYAGDDPHPVVHAARLADVSSLPGRVRDIPAGAQQRANSQGEFIYALDVFATPKGRDDTTAFLRLHRDVQTVGTLIDSVNDRFIRFSSVLEHDLVVLALDVPSVSLLVLAERCE